MDSRVLLFANSNQTIPLIANHIHLCLKPCSLLVLCINQMISQPDSQWVHRYISKSKINKPVNECRKDFSEYCIITHAFLQVYSLTLLLISTYHYNPSNKTERHKAKWPYVDSRHQTYEYSCSLSSESMLITISKRFLN